MEISSSNEGTGAEGEGGGGGTLDEMMGQKKGKVDYSRDRSKITWSLRYLIVCGFQWENMIPEDLVREEKT